jgi:hypothetical protein
MEATMHDSERYRSIAADCLSEAHDTLQRRRLPPDYQPTDRELATTVRTITQAAMPK